MDAQATSSKTILPEATREFMLADFEDRRADILQRIDRIEGQIRIGLVSSGAIWTWVLTHPGPLMKIAVWVPTCLVLYLTTAWLTQHFAILGIARYVKALEEKFFLPDGIGWETNLKQYQRTWLEPVTHAFWVVLLASNIIGSSYFTFVSDAAALLQTGP